VEIRFTLGDEDILNLTRVSSASGWGMFLFVSLLALMFLVGIYLIDHEFAAAGWLWLAASTAVGIATYEVPRVQARHSLRQNPSSHGEIVLRITDDGLESVFPTGISRLQWRAFTKYKETKDLFLLYMSPSRPAFIPKRVLSQEQVLNLRAILKKQILHSES
jgi:hypothetical protein